MKSVPIMFAGLAICAWGAYHMWHSGDLGEGFNAAKPFYIPGGIILFAGMLYNHWEHTRRRKE